MIRTREDLKRYLLMDEYALERQYKWYKINDPVLRFQRILRFHEYFANNKEKSLVYGIFALLYRIKHHRLGVRLGFDIPINVFGPGLRINHWGLIVVNPKAKIGKFCDIHQGVNIGVQGEDNSCPVIGDNVWIGPGAKLFGRIKIADDCQIGANAVVNKSFEECGISIAGVPAKKISKHPNPYKRVFSTI